MKKLKKTNFDISKLNDGAIKQLMTLISEDLNNDGTPIKLDHIMENLSIVNSDFSYFGINSPDLDDYTYLCELFVLNKTFDPPFKRPKLKSMTVYHSEDYTSFGTRYYEQTINTYTILDKDDMYSLQSEGYYEYWEGNLTEDDSHNYETEDDEITDVVLTSPK